MISLMIFLYIFLFDYIFEIGWAKQKDDKYIPSAWLCPTVHAYLFV
jgi:hypothetical protein